MKLWISVWRAGNQKAPYHTNELMLLLLLQRFRTGYSGTAFPLIQTNFEYQPASEGVENPVEVYERFGKILALRLCKD
jgi:hypothetical protein